MTPRFKVDHFFDADAIAQATDRARDKWLMTAGAMIRRTAQRSMKRRQGPSAPGTPPNSHVGTLRRLIFFAHDKANDTVVAGPVGFPLGSTTGAAVVTLGGSFTRRDGVTSEFPARPLMQPAYEERREDILNAWRNTVR
jgi:hypothetical protein